MRKSKRVLWASVLTALVAGTMAVGLYHRHYFVVFVFSVWVCVEFILWRQPVWRPRRREIRRNQSQLPFKALAQVFEKDTAEADNELAEQIADLFRSGSLNLYERQFLERLHAVLELRALAYRETGRGGKRRLRASYVYVKEPLVSHTDLGESSFAVQDMTETATWVAEMYWKLFDACSGKYPELLGPAHALYEKMFDEPYSDTHARDRIERVTDSMQRDFGLPFLVLNLIRTGALESARKISRELLRAYEDVEIDEEVRSALYWIGEIQWFVREETPFVGDYENCIRYLYHLCFTNPDRAGFLEIDSRFFSQFETINGLAQEGFLFKEVLIDKIFQLWSGQEGLFDGVFRDMLESMTGQNNKIYSDRETWERYWSRAREDFSKDQLFVVEGNLCYVSEHYEDAKDFFERALLLNSESRPALLNLLFCFARLKDRTGHEKIVHKILERHSLLPSAYYVIADSYILLGDSTTAQYYYEELAKFAGWERKADHYRSTFLYENGAFEEALYYAKKAHELNPEDTAISYHLSLCYDALGEKDRALDMVKKLGSSPTWMNYYRFTLERAMGQDREASETLLGIPREYFEDPEELNEAVEFARSRRDLVLLRHLRKKL